MTKYVDEWSKSVCWTDWCGGVEEGRTDAVATRHRPTRQHTTQRLNQNRSRAALTGGRRASLSLSLRECTSQRAQRNRKATTTATRSPNQSTRRLIIKQPMAERNGSTQVCAYMLHWRSANTHAGSHTVKFVGGPGRLKG